MRRANVDAMMAWALGIALAMATESADTWQIGVVAPWPDGLAADEVDLRAARVAGVWPQAHVEGTVQHIACTSPWCLVVVDWTVTPPEGPPFTTRTSGGAEATELEGAFLGALKRAVEELGEVSVEPPADVEVPSPTRVPPSRGDRWMIRGGYTLGVGTGLVLLSGVFNDPDVRGITVTTGVVAFAAGLGMAAYGLSLGPDQPSLMLLPSSTRAGGPGVEVVGRLRGRRARRYGSSTAGVHQRGTRSLHVDRSRSRTQP
ncbi:MAG: hypothetical protein AAGA48_22070 [Myxococcota bacterium]